MLQNIRYPLRPLLRIDLQDHQAEIPDLLTEAQIVSILLNIRRQVYLCARGVKIEEVVHVWFQLATHVVAEGVAAREQGEEAHADGPGVAERRVVVDAGVDGAVDFGRDEVVGAAKGLRSFRYLEFAELARHAEVADFDLHRA